MARPPVRVVKQPYAVARPLTNAEVMVGLGASEYAMARPPARVVKQPYAVARPLTNAEVIAKLPVSAEVMTSRARPSM